MFLRALQSPTDVESIFWYTGRMHHSGSMLRLKQHAHNIIFKESIIFAASPEQLGLTKANKLYPDHPYQVVRTRDAGYANNVEVKRFILDNLKKSKERYEGMFLTVSDFNIMYPIILFQHYSLCEMLYII